MSVVLMDLSLVDWKVVLMAVWLVLQSVVMMAGSMVVRWADRKADSVARSVVWMADHWAGGKAVQ